MNPTRDLLNALRRADSAEEKLTRIAQLLGQADASGMFGIATRDIWNILEASHE